MSLQLAMTSVIFYKNVPSIWASQYVSKQTGVADRQGRGKQEKHKKVEPFVNKHPSASVNVLTSG